MPTVNTERLYLCTAGNPKDYVLTMVHLPRYKILWRRVCTMMRLEQSNRGSLNTVEPCLIYHGRTRCTMLRTTAVQLHQHTCTMVIETWLEYHGRTIVEPWRYTMVLGYQKYHITCLTIDETYRLLGLFLNVWKQFHHKQCCKRPDQHYSCGLDLKIIRFTTRAVKLTCKLFSPVNNYF